jgi:hypothetical protein
LRKLHVKLHQHEAAEQEALPRCLLLKEPLGGLVMRRIRVRRVEEEVGVGGEDHERCAGGWHPSGRRLAGSVRKSPPQSSVGKRQTALGLWVLWEAGDEVLRRLAHDLRERPVLALGDLFEPLVKRLWELDLSSCHDVFYTSA